MEWSCSQYLAQSYMPCLLVFSDTGVAAQRPLQPVASLEWGVCAVSLDGQRLTMVASETIQEHSLPLTRGTLRLTWELHRPNYGNTISLQTGEIGGPF